LRLNAAMSRICESSRMTVAASTGSCDMVRMRRPVAAWSSVRTRVTVGSSIG
jgi:hypothetical protein